MSIVNMVAGNISLKFGAKGVCQSVVTACASGANNIGEAFRYIKHGYADMCFAGGSEYAITKTGVADLQILQPLPHVRTLRLPANLLIKTEAVLF